MRIGHGYDVHALAELNSFELPSTAGAGNAAAGGQSVRPLRLGGVDIPHSHGCVAHSDGDVVVHALCDALLGAVAAGDIGLHFPDTSDEFRGVDSLELLRRTVAVVAGKGYRVGNVDCTVAMQVPKIAPFIGAMREALAGALCLPVDAVSVKATTTERLGFVGRSEGVAAWAVVLVLCDP